MSATGNLPEKEQVHNLATGYTTGGPGSSPGASPSEAAPGRSGSLRSTEGSLPYRGTSAGGLYSTLGDLLKFVMALTSNKLLDARYTELLTTGKVVTPRRAIKYAFGFKEETTPENIRFFGHGGGGPGWDSEQCRFRGPTPL